MLSTLTPPNIRHIEQELAKRELARRFLIYFIKYTFKDVNGFNVTKFANYLCNELERFLSDVIAKKSPTLLIQVPPRHGKTEIVTRRFIPWVLGKYPHFKILLTTYAAGLASSFNKSIQSIMVDPTYKLLFPQTRLAETKTKDMQQYKKTATCFDVVGYTDSFLSVGVGGGLTGFGGDILIVDDPHKNMQEAESPTMRRMVKEWYQSTFSTRAHPGAGTIVIQTRWHVADLSGEIEKAALENGLDNFKIIRLPAIAGSTDPFRQEGEVLDEQRYPYERLMGLKKSVGDKVFGALYQQSPTLDGGNIFKLDWFKFVDRHLIERIEFDSTAIFVDTASKTKELNDFTVITAVGVKENKLYIRDMVRAKVEAIARENLATMMYDKYSTYPFAGMYIESANSGVDLYQRLLDSGRMVKEINRSKDKVTRAFDAAPYMEQYNIYLPNDLGVKSELLDEVSTFPLGPHDDMVDTIMDACKWGYSATPLDYDEIRRALFGDDDIGDDEPMRKYLKSQGAI